MAYLDDDDDDDDGDDDDDDFYQSGFSDYSLHIYLYIHNISADASLGLLQVFLHTEEKSPLIVEQET